MRQSLSAGGPHRIGVVSFSGREPGARGAVAGDDGRSRPDRCLGQDWARVERSLSCGPLMASRVDAFLRALCTWGHMSTNDAGWPKFYGKYFNYLWFKKE